ncbi:unnamed protein product [Gongylonema pulchrum]|uniref:Helicase C-terminal domain-containing protein n=1 Tax=Gongylonema pulchrum TaxID=637853 RepID=A0A183DCS3_9BILA|nr:unnamed protein product [Gongylonema pulchrum]
MQEQQFTDEPNCVTIDDLYSASRLQKILVSATLSLDVEDLREWRLRHPRLFKAIKDNVIVSSRAASSDSIIIPDSLKLEVVVCDTKLKPLAIYEQIERHRSWKKILIFVNSRMASYRLALLLKALSAGKYLVEELSSNLFGNRRQKVLARYGVSLFYLNFQLTSCVVAKSCCELTFVPNIPCISGILFLFFFKEMPDYRCYNHLLAFLSKFFFSCLFQVCRCCMT